MKWRRDIGLAVMLAGMLLEGPAAAQDPAGVRPPVRSVQVAQASLPLSLRISAAPEPALRVVRPVARPPATARGYKCNVGTGEALKNGAANLSCGLRIMAHTVARDGVIHGRDSRWRGVAADWGPMRSPSKRADMARWLNQQTYCKPRNATRPRARP